MVPWPFADLWKVWIVEGAGIQNCTAHLRVEVTYFFVCAVSTWIWFLKVFFDPVSFMRCKKTHWKTYICIYPLAIGTYSIPQFEIQPTGICPNLRHALIISFKKQLRKGMFVQDVLHACVFSMVKDPKEKPNIQCFFPLKTSCKTHFMCSDAGLGWTSPLVDGMLIYP